ncbi:MAG: DUF3306 domain-containing protein [Alphaproteobacteria bacterium]|nr:DUF3306 domain-containing protein [Alphaproteobacteria bacterium]
MAANDFFSRWSKPAAVQTGLAPVPAPTIQSSVTAAPDKPKLQATEPPTLEQAQAATPADDFSAFVRPDVDPKVRNTAMKRLFSDPHFNVMDGLDIYIDDYNTPDPLPASDLARMASAQFLRLLQSEPETTQAPAGAVDSGKTPVDDAPQALAESQLQPETHRDDPDLRLQPNPEAGPASPESSTG